MEKVYREMLDIIRAEVADLYRLRRVDAERLCRLERSPRRETAEQSCGRCVPERRPGSGDAEVPVI